jgi:hypothetical protein
MALGGRRESSTFGSFGGSCTMGFPGIASPFDTFGISCTTGFPEIARGFSK